MTPERSVEFAAACRNALAAPIWKIDEVELADGSLRVSASMSLEGKNYELGFVNKPGDPPERRAARMKALGNSMAQVACLTPDERTEHGKGG